MDKSLFLFSGLSVSTHNSEHMFFTFIHSGPLEIFYFMVLEVWTMPLETTPAMSVDVMEEATA